MMLRLSHLPRQAPDVYFCGVCSLDFATAAAAAQHRMDRAHRDAVRDRASGASGRESRERRCPHCHELRRGLADLRRHLQAEHPDRKHRCALCGLAFTLPQEVSRHHRAVHADAAKPRSANMSEKAAAVLPAERERPPYLCPPCGFSSDSRAEMAFHRVLHGPAATLYRCPVCADAKVDAKADGRDRLYRKPALRVHLHAHTGERPFRCAHCDKAFRSVRYWTLRVHPQRKPHCAAPLSHQAQGLVRHPRVVGTRPAAQRPAEPAEPGRRRPGWRRRGAAAAGGRLVHRRHHGGAGGAGGDPAPQGGEASRPGRPTEAPPMRRLRQSLLHQVGRPHQAALAWSRPGRNRAGCNWQVLGVASPRRRPYTRAARAY